MPRSEQTETRRRGRARASWPTGHTSIFLDRVGSLRLIPPFEYSGFGQWSTLLYAIRKDFGGCSCWRARAGHWRVWLSARAAGRSRACRRSRCIPVHCSFAAPFPRWPVASPGGASSRKSRGARIPWRIRTGSRAWTPRRDRRPAGTAPVRVQLCYSERAVAPPPSRLRPWCCKVRFRPQ